MRRKIYSLVLLAAGLLIGTNAWAEKTLVAQMTALEQTTAFYMDEVVDVDNHIYASAYDALTAALVALPDNSTPAVVKLYSDVAINFESYFFEVPINHNVTIDLNGRRMDAKTDLANNSAIIKNYGTLTIMDSSEGGIISNFAPNADIKDIPGFGNYTILNMGTLILNSGTLENVGTGNEGGACYCVENHWNSDGYKYSPTFIMNGGKLNQPKASAVRMYLNGTMYENSTNSVIINGGEINAVGYGVIVHYSTSSTIAPHVVFTVNGGKIKGSYAYEEINYIKIIMKN